VHEVSVMASIVEAVLEELKKHDVEKVEEVHR
jgi:Zn finger protein HypA/HybF involved in hydrogenase expression